MIGQSPAFREMLRYIEKMTRCDAPVLIEGETGTGKELVARAIHYGGTRGESPFIPVNCGAIPDALIENELFGHKRGAYTDAQSDDPGLITHARHGTLFLDEVDALSPKAQIVLLRFLQDQQYRPLGGAQILSADVRVIVASNVNLTRLAEQGAFRLDLLFRLKIMYLKLPPLRERQGDAALLANHFLQVCAQRFGYGDKTLHPDTLAWLDQYYWPGNIRELENMICREYLLEDSAVIHIKAPQFNVTERRSGKDRRQSTLTSEAFSEAKSHVIARFEQCYLSEVLAKAQGNVTKAAKLAGKERRAFGKLLKKYCLDKSLYYH